MAPHDWDWRYPVEIQDYPWDCAAASLAWALNAYGLALSEQAVVAGLGPSRISPTHGLLDASGAGIVEYLGELGIPAANNPHASWHDITGAAGHQPMIMGGRAWCHWTGVRMSTLTADYHSIDIVALANPSPGYMGVEQVINSVDFDELGDFSAVWFPA